jgi:hypothetical protein
MSVELLDQLRQQGALRGFLEDADRLNEDFRKQFDYGTASKCLN